MKLHEWLDACAKSCGKSARGGFPQKRKPLGYGNACNLNP